MMPRLTTTFLVSLVVFVTILDCQRVEAADVNKMIGKNFRASISQFTSPTSILCSVHLGLTPKARFLFSTQKSSQSSKFFVPNHLHSCSFSNSFWNATLSTYVLLSIGEEIEFSVEMFKKADKNKDGKWSFAEYLQRDENLIKFEKQRFRKHDANGRFRNGSAPLRRIKIEIPWLVTVSKSFKC